MNKLIVLIIVLLATPLFGANEIQVAYTEGSTLYARVREADGDVWNTPTTAFQNWADANVADYDIALTDEEGAHYQGDFPSCSAGRYTVSVYVRSGGSPAVADVLIGTNEIVWNGSAEQIITDDLTTIIADSNELQTGWADGGRLDLLIDAIDDFLDTEVASIVADTNELQTSWQNTGRLDTILDAIPTEPSAPSVD